MEEALAETEAETASLIQQQKKQSRDSEQVSDEMYSEAKRLLGLFGIPYIGIRYPPSYGTPTHPTPTHGLTAIPLPMLLPFIDAPTEAEAQCAQLEKADLVDGVVTEDNDALLFGARCVYKHLFDPQHHVEVRRAALMGLTCLPHSAD